jgi:tetratricopeptide (TPR) repeat protein
MKKLFIILAVMAIMFGCTERQHPLIRQAWEMIEEKPESAKVVLAKIYTNSLTESDMADYGLLKTMVTYKTHGMYKTYGMVENDSLITVSIVYYNQHGDDWHRGRAYYYRGAIRMSKLGNIPDAVKDFKVAEIISEAADDEELKNLVYGMLYLVNVSFNNHPQTLKYAHKWLNSNIELNDSVKILQSLLECATAYADIGQTDSACIYIEKALSPQMLSLASEERGTVNVMKGRNGVMTSYLHLLPEIYAQAAKIYQEHGDDEKTMAYLTKWKETSLYIGYLPEARIRKAQGQYEKAIELVREELINCDRKTRMQCMEQLSELYELTGNQEQALEAKKYLKAYDDSMKYINQVMQMAEWQQKFDEVQQTKEFYRRTSWMQGLIIAMIVVVTLAIGVGMWLHRRKVRRLSFRLDEDARRISELRTKIELQEKSGEENSLEMARIKEELESRMERISGTLLVGTQMFSQLQQRQCIAEATAKEQQCLVDYFAQLRPKRWQEWERKYSGLSTAQYIFLIMQDDLHFDDEAIATALNVKRTSVRSMRSRIKGRER